ncbi:hypothetical protein DPMN_055466 [Dreissena polymorpha]|uniref:Uncharacterized protein n=1 Tax=Dreissena polymorpha TaxID=45954 RepID=A0A9D4CRP5_DREPO|nr:hypothetical protein DPMN_055466 [Dreissena polymorpha]
MPLNRVDRLGRQLSSTSKHSALASFKAVPTASLTSSVAGFCFRSSLRALGELHEHAPER